MDDIRLTALVASRALVVPAELTDDDLAWVREQAALAGAVLERDRPGKPAVTDLSWLTTEKIRG